MNEAEKFSMSNGMERKKKKRRRIHPHLQKAWTSIHSTKSVYLCASTKEVLEKTLLWVMVSSFHPSRQEGQTHYSLKLEVRQAQLADHVVFVI